MCFTWSVALSMSLSSYMNNSQDSCEYKASSQSLLLRDTLVMRNALGFQSSIPPFYCTFNQ